MYFILIYCYRNSLLCSIILSIANWSFLFFYFCHLILLSSLLPCLLLSSPLLHILLSPLLLISPLLSSSHLLILPLLSYLLSSPLLSSLTHTSPPLLSPPFLLLSPLLSPPFPFITITFSHSPSLLSFSHHIVLSGPNKEH